MHTKVLISWSSKLAPLALATDQEAEHIVQAVKKRALAVLLPYPVVSGLRDVSTCTRPHLHTATKGDAYALDDLDGALFRPESGQRTSILRFVGGASRPPCGAVTIGPMYSFATTTSSSHTNWV
jgi:hypothetical protein